MGALAPINLWLPQDDLLLKNAVEAGASLEALAKGAVQFSRRFTLQELQNRWYSLLYDPVVSLEASVRMIEVELSASTLQSKKIENKSNLGKRKAQSIRKCYYAMRKRICNDPLYSMDLNFLNGPGFDSAGSEPISTNCFIGDDLLYFDRIEELNFGVDNGSFIQQIGTNGVASSTDDLSAMALNTGFCDIDETSLGQSNPVQDVCLPVNSISLTGVESPNSKLGPSEELQEDNFLETVDLEVRHPDIFGQTTENEAIVFSGSGCEVINSSISGCPAPLQNVGYASSVLQMPVMDTSDSPSSSTLHDDCLVNNVPHADSNIQIQGGTDVANRSSVHLKSELVDQTCCYKMELPPDAEDHFPEQVTGGNLGNLAPNADEYFEQLSNSLLNFNPEDELLLMDADGKEIIDNSCIELSSLLLDCPDESDMQSLGLSEASFAPQECFEILSVAPCEESYNEEQYHCDDQPQVWSADTQKLSSALTVNPMFPELRNGVICCTLNTEDTEVPDNDDVFLPICFTSTSISWMESTKSNEVYYPVPFSDEEFSCNHKTTYRFMLQGERCKNAEVNVPNQATGQLLSEMGPNYHMNDSGLRFELPCSDAQNMFKKAGTSECPNHAFTTQVNKADITPGSLRESLKKVEQSEELNDKSSCSHIQKQTDDLHVRLTSQNEAVVCKQEADCMSADQNNGATHAELSSTMKTVPEQAIDGTLSDHERFSSESDSQLPYFSDVEAMIHDMDLCPDDDLDVYHSPAVLRYQDEGARKTIIRLEQAAAALTQRSIAVHGAFAVLYGRHSKYFIKKPEVLLGRGTEDSKVDIDLGREACASKISRRQATLKLESDGTFHLTNHGKFPVFVNGKEIVPGQTFGLISGYLIEELADKGISISFRDEQKIVQSSCGLSKTVNISYNWLFQQSLKQAAVHGNNSFFGVLEPVKLQVDLCIELWTLRSKPTHLAFLSCYFLLGGVGPESAILVLIEIV